jgi:hypothetical protein
MFLTELPQPLLTREFQHRFIEASQIEGKKPRLIAVHELVNQLPDVNYVVLKCLTKHWAVVSHHHESNQAHVSELAGLFGPVLMDADSKHSAIVLETIIRGYNAIFEP